MHMKATGWHSIKSAALDICTICCTDHIGRAQPLRAQFNKIAHPRLTTFRWSISAPSFSKSLTQVRWPANSARSCQNTATTNDCCCLQRNFDRARVRAEKFAASQRPYRCQQPAAREDHRSGPPRSAVRPVPRFNLLLQPG